MVVLHTSLNALRGTGEIPALAPQKERFSAAGSLEGAQSKTEREPQCLAGSGLPAKRAGAKINRGATITCIYSSSARNTVIGFIEKELNISSYQK